MIKLHTLSFIVQVVWKMLKCYQFCLESPLGDCMIFQTTKCNTAIPIQNPFTIIRILVNMISLTICWLLYQQILSQMTFYFATTLTSLMPYFITAITTNHESWTRTMACHVLILLIIFVLGGSWSWNTIGPYSVILICPKTSIYSPGLLHSQGPLTHLQNCSQRL